MEPGSSARDAVATEDASSESWDTVHLTPLTAEKELTHIAVSCSFVLHSTGGYSVAPPATSLHTVAPSASTGTAATLPEGLPASMNIEGSGSVTLPSYTDAAGQRAAKETEGATAPSADAAAAAAGSTRGPAEVYGAYRGVRVIHNVAPCLVRCAAEVGLPSSSTLGRPNTSNTLGSVSVGYGSLPAVTATAASAPPTAQPAFSPSPSFPPQSPQSTEAGTNSQVQSSAQSTLDSSAPQGSPLAPPQQPSFTTTKAATAAPPTAAQSSTSQQLQQLTSAYARSAMRRSSKASSRRSHTSSSSLPESVVFLDPLEIIADAAISFEDIVFATHVSVRGKGPVHFINCCFGPSSTPQLSQQFVSAPLSAEGDGRRQTYLQVVPAADAVQSTEHGTGVSSSSEVAGRPSGWATTAAATKSPTVSGTVPTDATQPVGHDDNEDNNNITPARSTPLHAPCDSSSGVFGLLTGFALPAAMQVLRARRRGFLSSAVPAGMADPLSRSSPQQQQQQQQSGATTSCCTFLKDGQTTCPTMTAFHDSAAASVVDVYGGAVCELNQCDLYGGSAGASLVCREHSRVTVTDSSFDGPSITWAAIEVRDAAAATVQFTNIQQVIGVGILVVDRGSATVDSSVIERCGTAGVVVTDNGTLSLFNTGVEASASGVCVSLSGSAEAKMVGCGFTTRFPLPRRAAGLMFVKHLQTIGAFRSSRCTGPTSPAQDSLASINDDPLLQHVLNADLESLLGLWLLWIGDADTAFPTSSQSVVLSDHAVAGVTECEFTSTMRLPGSSVSSATASTAQNIADTTAMEETPSSSHSRANRSEGAVPSFTGLPPAAASAIAVMLSGSEANLSGTNSRGMSSSGHNLVHNAAASAGNAFLLPGSSATRRHPAGSEETGRRDGFPYVARKSVTTFSDSIDRVDSEEAMPLPSGLVRHASRSSTIPVAAFVDAASEKVGERGGRAQLSGAGTPAASTAGGPPPLHATAATAAAATAAAAGTLSTTSGSPLLPLPVRNVVAGLLSSYVMAWEVFGEYLGQRRRAHASCRPPTTTSAATRTSSSSSLVVETPKAGPESKPAWRSSGGGGGEEERTFTDLFLTFEAPTEINNGGGGAEEGTSAMRLSPTTHSAGPDGDNAGGAAGRRLGLLSAAAMQSLQGSLQQLGCLTVLMAPNGGVYHIVASQQASLALTSSVLSLALPPQLMVTMPSSWASAAGCYYVGGTAAFSSTIRTTAAPFVAAVLDYHEPEKVSAAGHSSAAASPSRGGTAKEGGGRERKAGQLQRQHKEHQSGGAPFCSIFTRSNVIRYECVSLATAQSKAEQTSRPSTKTTATWGSVQRQEGGQGEGTRETANIALTTPTTAAAVAAASGSTNGRPAQRGSMGLDEEDLAEAGESSTVHSIFGAGVSGYSYNNSIRRRGVGADNDAPKPAGVARNSAQLPPRPASASASAAQHPHQQQQQQQPLADDCDNHTSTSSSAVDFNTAAWGLVLVTPPATRHSEALEAAVRMQAEHWCRVEITPSQAPSINRVGSSATSSTAVPDTGREGPLEVPTPLRRNSASPAAAVSPSSRGTSASTRTAGGSTSVGRGSALGDGAQLDSVDVTETSEAGRSGGAREASEMPDTQGSQVHHLGNIFLNMTNQAELLSVTHPEHICTAFSNFARVMELPAAQEYPTTPSAGTSPLLFKQTPSLGGGAAAAATNATAGTSAGGAGATAGPTLEDKDAPPLPAHRAHLDAGRVGAAATTTALPSATTGTAAATTTTTISGYSSPTATAPYNTFPSLHTGEREVSRLHVNADLQRQMLLGDVDAPPLYAAAAVAAAVRDASEDVGGCASRVYDVSQAAMSSMLRSVDRTKIGGNNQSSTSTRPSNRSTPSPERMHAGVAAMAAAAREEEERVRLLAATKAGAQQVQSFSMPGSALSSRVASQHRNPSFPTSPLAPAAAAAAAVMQAPANTGPVIAPSPPQISILDVVSEASWSNSTDSSSNGSESDSDDSGSVSRRSSNSSGGGSEGSGRRRNRGAQLEVRSKWAFKLRKSSSSTHHSFRPNNAADGVHGDARQGVLESGTTAERSQTSSDTNADLMHVAADGESAVSTSESSVGNASDERRAEAEAVARSEAEQQARRRVSPRPPSLFPPLPSLPAAQAPPSPQLATAAASPVVSLPQLSHVTNHALPDSAPAPFAPEPLLPERRAHNDTPLIDRAATAATAAASASSTASSQPRTVSSSSQSSKAGRADSEQHQPSRHSVTHAMGPPPVSSSDSSRRSSPVVAPTRPGSHQRRSGAADAVENQQRQHRGGSRATTSVAPTVAAPRAAAASAAAAAAVGVAQSDATLERVAQLEEQLLLLQRSMLLHQTRMAQMQCAFQHSTSSQTESSAMENQPSLLALPPNLKTFADGSDHTNGNSKDSRRTQSSSYPSSFSASKIQSASTSHAAADAPALETTAAQPAPQAMLPLPLPAAATAAAHVEIAHRETATRPPVSPSTEERHHAAPDAVAAEAASTTAAAVQEVDEEKDVHITQVTSQNVSDTNAANVNVASLPSIDAHAPRHQSPSPPPAAAAAAAPAPVARPKTMLAPAPPLTSPPGSLQSPPQRPRPRHPSASTTLQLLLAAAQSSLFGSTTSSSASAPTTSIDGTSMGGENSTSWNAPQHHRYLVGDALDDVGDEDRRWEEALLRRLRSAHYGDGPDLRGSGERWRERFPPSGPPVAGSKGRRPDSAGAYPQQQQRRRHSETVELWGAGVGPGTETGYVDGAGEAEHRQHAHRPPGDEPHPPPLGTPGALFEPWRTTVATGTRYAHQPPPHPYAFPPPPPPPPAMAAEASDFAAADDADQPPRRREMRLPIPLPTPPLSASSVTSSRRPLRPSSCPVPPTPYIELASSSQLTAAGLLSPLPVPPQALYLSGRRRSHQRPPPPRQQQQQQQQASINRPPYASTASLASPSALIAHLHEDHLHDQYARAAWNAVVAQSQQQQRERQRLTSPLQSAQVHRLYAEPIRDRAERAAAHAQPTPQQLYRLHGCTFTPKINDSRTASRRPPSRQRTGSRSGARPLHNADLSIDSLHAPLAQTSNTSTVISENAGMSTNAQNTSVNPRRGMPRR